jgi:hypothetical protein
MQITTRKVNKSDVDVLQNIQRHLKRKGLKLSQQELLGQIIRYISENELEFIKNIDNKQSTDNNELLKKWLEKPIDGEESDAVKEHDGVI